MPQDIARAKINLTLHVGRKIENQADPFYGYHPLDSLVVFSDLGDRISCETSGQESLDITGPFAKGLIANNDNLIFKAYHAVQRVAACPTLAFRLEKNLPVAAGIGGGSANAAAVLRLLQTYAPLTNQQLQHIALSLGADVPVCLSSRTARMTGIGDTVSPVAGLGQQAAILANPGVAVITQTVFEAFDSGMPKETPRPQKNTGTLLERAIDGRNDLQPAAQRIAPIITQVIDALKSEAGCRLARMSGSGATCFGLYDDFEMANQAAAQLARKHPEWWVQATRFGEAT